MKPPCPTVQRALDLLNAGRADQAEPMLRRHLLKQPGDATGNHILAATLLHLGRPDQAAFFASRANALFPGDFAILSVLGTALMAGRRTPEALAALESAARLAPNDPAVLNTYGVALTQAERLPEAVERLRRSLELKPDSPSVIENLVAALVRLGDNDATRDLLRRAIGRWPEHEPFRLAWTTQVLYDSGVSAAEIRSAHEHLARRIEARSTPLPPPAPRASGPLRVGLISPDFRQHSVSWFVEPLLAALAQAGASERLGMELRCYASNDEDGVTARLRRHGHPWVDVSAMTDAAAAQRVRADGVDVLIDLAGHSAHNRLGVLALRPAPVQMTYLGYPATTGLAACDYRIADSRTDPPGSEDACSERLLRLDPCFLCYRPAPDLPALPAAPPSVGAGRITFGSFNSVLKISERCAALWARVLLAVPGSRLLLKQRGLEHAPARERLASMLARHGVTQDRLDFLPLQVDLNEHLSTYARMDIALDTVPYNGTTTTCEALMMGVPVVTVAGGTHAARVGASLLHAVGAPELVAADEDAFVSLALALAGDAGRLAGYRRGLRDRVLASVLCDEPGFVARFAACVRRAYEGAVGNAPGHP